MKNILRATLTALLFLLGSPVAAANVSSFTIDGIRLGMTSDQVYKALASRSTQQPAIEHSYCFKEPQPQYPGLNGGSCVSRIIAVLGKSQMQVDFIEDFPVHPRRMEVSSILFTGVLANNTEESASVFRKAVFARYGKPTTSEHTDENVMDPQMSPAAYLWCSGGSVKNCDTHVAMDADYSLALSNKPFPAQCLILSGGSRLALLDHAYGVPRLKAMAHAKALQTNPGF